MIFQFTTYPIWYTYRFQKSLRPLLHMPFKLQIISGTENSFIEQIFQGTRSRFLNWSQVIFLKRVLMYFFVPPKNFWMEQKSTLILKCSRSFIIIKSESAKCSPFISIKGSRFSSDFQKVVSIILK